MSENNGGETVARAERDAPATQAQSGLVQMRGIKEPLIHSLADVMTLAEIVAKSNAFPSIKNPGMAAIKILGGMEMGFGPFASLLNIHLFDGNVQIGSHLLAAAIRGSGRYDYAITEDTDQAVTVSFLRKRPDGSWEEIGIKRITLEDAVAKGWTVTAFGKEKTTWTRTPAAMLFNRCLSAGYKVYTPDISGGVLTYTADEFDGEESIALPAHPAVPSLPASPPAAVMSPAAPPSPPALAPPVAAPRPVSNAQRDRVDELTVQLAIQPAALKIALRAYYHTEDIGTLNGDQVDDLIRRLETKLKSITQPAGEPEGNAPRSQTPAKV